VREDKGNNSIDLQIGGAKQHLHFQRNIWNKKKIGEKDTSSLLIID
jgi:hypothetical protein